MQCCAPWPLVAVARLVLEDDVQGVDDAGNVACEVSIGFRVGGGAVQRSNVPRQVSRMLMSRSAPQPRSRKTPRGGRRTAKMILMMSLGC